MTHQNIKHVGQLRYAKNFWHVVRVWHVIWQNPKKKEQKYFREIN